MCRLSARNSIHCVPVRVYAPNSFIIISVRSEMQVCWHNEMAQVVEAVYNGSFSQRTFASVIAVF